jgi:hypothetical protein
LAKRIHDTCSTPFHATSRALGRPGPKRRTKGKVTVGGIEDNGGEEGIGQVGLTSETLEAATMP